MRFNIPIRANRTVWNMDIVSLLTKKKFRFNRDNAVKRMQVHQVTQFYFNDRFFFYMESFNKRSDDIKKIMNYMYDANSNFKTIVNISRTVIDAKDEVSDSSNSSAHLQADRIVQKGRIFAPSEDDQSLSFGEFSHFEQQKKFVPSEAMKERYKGFVTNITEHKQDIDQLDSKVDEMGVNKDALRDSINNYLSFTDVIEKQQKSFEHLIKNYMFGKGLMERYYMSDVDIWFFGWLLYSQQNNDIWKIRPKDMVSSRDGLHKLNKTDFLIIKDYLDDLIEEMANRVIFNKKNNAHFGFQLQRGIGFNITDIKNVTNCTNGELSCPCKKGEHPNGKFYCQPTNDTTNSTTGSGSSTARILQTASTNPFAPETDKPAGTNQTNNTLTGKTYRDQIVIVTPQTAFKSFEKNYMEERELRAFALAFKFVANWYYNNMLSN